MNNRLSHSAASKFQDCPKAYELHYRQRLRSKLINSSLLFGTAVDRAIQDLLNGKDAYAGFDAEWHQQTVNNVLVELKNCLSIVYSNSDYDRDLLLPEDTKELYTKLRELKYPEDAAIVYEIIDKKKDVGFENLTDDEKSVLNLGNWLVCKRRGHLMIDAFKTHVMPKIRRVLAVQKEINLDNGAGDSIIGFADMICEMEGYGNVVLDLKTAAQPYEETSVLTSPQLSLYVAGLGEEYATRLAGYIVLVKRVNKNRVKTCKVCGVTAEAGSRVKTCANTTTEGTRCGGEFAETVSPELTQPQIIIDEIPEQTESIVIENFDHINTSIKNNDFHRNFGSCVKPWGKCTYYDLCYKNRTDDLILLEKKEEK